MHNHVRERRKEAGLTQEDLGAQIGATRQTVIAIEQGRYNPSLPLALKIARVFQVPVEEVFRLDDPPEQAK